jgi:hypothetical protein
MKGELAEALSTGDERRSSVTEEELRALGTIITLEGADASYPLKVDSLQQLSRHTTRPKKPKWMLLSVVEAQNGRPEIATVWVSDAYRAEFLRLFEHYLDKTSTRASPDKWLTPDGNPANSELVANIGRIRSTILSDLWQSAGPPPSGREWWEIWLDPREPQALDLIAEYVETRQLTMINRHLAFSDRIVVWIQAKWTELEALPFTRVPVAEIRRPEFTDTVEDLPPDEQAEFVADLASRLSGPSDDGIAVVHLDTGVLAGHVLLAPALNIDDVHTIIGASGDDVSGHGTGMASLALYGPLDDLLTSTGTVRLPHRIESVRMYPSASETPISPRDYGTSTIQAVSIPEAANPARRRVYCMPLSAPPDLPGQPTLWSTTVDALAAGVQVVQEDEGLRFLGAPDDGAKRLIVIAAGNVDQYDSDHLSRSDISAIEDPAQAWNALTVGAHTELVDLPADPAYNGWSAVAETGELSPHSRTSLAFNESHWPIKPDICMEGGNVLTDGWGFETRHPLLSLRAASSGGDHALASVNATSAATAQASRLAAMAMRSYPDYWPESIRALLVHSAEWTPAMRARVDGTLSKAEKLQLLRRYGWGTPTEAAVLRSSRQAVTLVSQDDFVPFEGSDYRMRSFRLHTLPWPHTVLTELGSAAVTMKVTLSYFVEPSPSRRGWRERYSYASHGLRFELQNAGESQASFVDRVNRNAGRDEDGTKNQTGTDRWLIGPNQRNLGTLHQDIWEGTGSKLAQCNTIAVYPVGGWWKRNRRADRLDLPVRYSLVVSLKTEEQEIDLYTPIAVDLQVTGAEIEVPAT